MIALDTDCRGLACWATIHLTHAWCTCATWSQIVTLETWDTVCWVVTHRTASYGSRTCRTSSDSISVETRTTKMTSFLIDIDVGISTDNFSSSSEILSIRTKVTIFYGIDSIVKLLVDVVIRVIKDPYSEVISSNCIVCCISWVAGCIYWICWSWCWESVWYLSLGSSWVGEIWGIGSCIISSRCYYFYRSGSSGSNSYVSEVNSTLDFRILSTDDTSTWDRKDLNSSIDISNNSIIVHTKFACNMIIRNIFLVMWPRSWGSPIGNHW